jgi:hypothetical protein
MGEAGGFYAIYDDGNPAWEDMEEEDPILAELRSRQDDVTNGDVVGTAVDEDELIARSREVHAAGARQMKAIAFKRWKHYWKSGICSLACKMALYNKRQVFSLFW